MEISIKQCELVQGIRIVQKAISNNPTILILKGVLITAEKDNVKLFACDEDLYIETQLNSEVIKPGKIVTNAKVFSDIVNKLKDEYIKLTVCEEQQVNIKCKNIDIKLRCYNVDNFPQMPDIVENNVINIKEKNFNKMINQTSFAISEKDEKHSTDCELIEIKGDKLSMVGTDKIRIAVSRHLLKNNKEIDTRSKVLGKSLIEVKKLLSSSSENYIKIKSNEKYVLLITPNTKVCATIPYGGFIDYESVFPKKYNTQIKVNRKELLNLLEIVTVIFENENPVALFKIEKNNMTILAKSDLGEINEKIEVDLSGENMKISFNIDYLLEVLKVIDEEKIIFSFTKGRGQCGVITPDYDTKNEEEYEYLIIPLRLKE